MIDPCDLLLPQSKLRLKKSADLVAGNNEDENDIFLQEMHNERLQDEVQREFAEKMRAEKATHRKVKRGFISAMSQLQTGSVSLLYMVNFQHTISYLSTRDVCRLQCTSRDAFQYIIGALPLKPHPKGNYPSSSKTRVPAVKPLETQCNSIFHHYMSTAHFCRAVELAEFPLVLQYACLHINTDGRRITPAQCAALHSALAKYDMEAVARAKKKQPGHAPYSQTVRAVNVNSATIFMDKDIDSTEVRLLVARCKGNELLQYLRSLSLEGA
jgi:hypothetical protein